MLLVSFKKCIADFELACPAIFLVYSSHLYKSKEDLLCEYKTKESVPLIKLSNLRPAPVARLSLERVDPELLALAQSRQLCKEQYLNDPSDFRDQQ